MAADCKSSSSPTTVRRYAAEKAPLPTRACRLEHKTADFNSPFVPTTARRLTLIQSAKTFFVFISKCPWPEALSNDNTFTSFKNLRRTGNIYALQRKGVLSRVARLRARESVLFCAGESVFCRSNLNIVPKAAAPT